MSVSHGYTHFYIEILAFVNGGITCFFLERTPGKNALDASKVTLKAFSTI